MAVPAGRHRPVAAGTLVDTWWFITIITIITWFTRLGVDTSGHPCCCEKVPGLGTVINCVWNSEMISALVEPKVRAGREAELQKNAAGVYGLCIE